jgi:N-acetylglutamate synthase-like GNAT family acetyltransferase
VKGQNLFVRPIEAADADTLRRFAAENGGPMPATSGLLGKLVGDVAAVLSMQVEEDGIRIIDLVVAEPLRRKRVGRVMLNELADLAVKLERKWLVADVANAAFLQKVGFVNVDGVMKRRVG